MNPLFCKKEMKNFLPLVKLNCHDNFHRVITRYVSRSVFQLAFLAVFLHCPCPNTYFAYLITAHAVPKTNQHFPTMRES